MKFLKLNDVIKLTCYKKSAIYQKIAEGSFPKQVKLGAKSVVWLERDILAWMSSKIEEAQNEAVYRKAS